MWKTVKLGDVCTITNGSTPLRKEKRYWEKGNVPWFTIDDFRVQGKNITYTQQNVTQAAVDDKKVRLVPANSVLLCCTASIGEAAIARVEMATNQQFNALTPKSTALNSDYLYFVATTLTQTLLSVSGSTTINFISMGKLKEISIPLPPLAEQQRIVAKLDAAFAEIDGAIEAVEKNVESLGGFFENFLDKELFCLKNDFNVKLIKDFGKAKGGKRLPKGANFSVSKTSHPYLRIVDFSDGGDIDETNLKYIDDGIFSKIGKYTITNKDVYIAIVGATIGKTGIIQSNLNGANLTENAAKIVLTEDCSAKYFYYCSRAKFFKQQVLKKARAAAQPKLALVRLEMIEVPVPNNRQQNILVEKFDNVSKDIESVKNLYLKKLSNFHNLKTSILASILSVNIKEDAA